MTKFSVSKKSGFTMIELVIVLVISAVILSGALPLIIKTTTANKSARLRQNAYEAAHQEIENIRGSNISDLTNHSFPVANVPGAAGQIIINNTVEGSPQSNIVSVVSRVQWSFHEKSEQVELKTYLYGEE